MKNILQLYRDNAAQAKQPTNIVRNAAEASLYIYDIIDAYWGVSALQVIDAVNAVGDAEVLHVYINSPGGSVFEGRAIMAALARFKGKTIAHIDSLCASAATSIALACNEVEMSAGAFFMIHNASGLAWGDKTDMRETADLLEKIEGSIIADYMTKTSRSEVQIIEWMDAETWFSADEALANGFIDRITAAPVSDGKANNAWNLAAYAKAPAELAAAPSNVAKAEPAPTVKNITTMSDAESALMRSLIPHYAAVVDLSKAALALCETDSVIEFVEDVISDHAGDLELLETWTGVDEAAEAEEIASNVTPSMTQANRNRLALATAL